MFKCFAFFYTTTCANDFFCCQLIFEVYLTDTQVVQFVSAVTLEDIYIYARLLLNRYCLNLIRIIIIILIMEEN